MLKNIILGIAIFLILLTAGVMLFELLQKPKISNNLSDRGREFIEAHKADDGSLPLNKLIADKIPDTRGKRIQVGNCFSFVMPYSVFNSRQDGECNAYFGFDRPKGSIVAFMEDATSGSIDQASGVSMRRIYKNKYEEKEYKIGDEIFTMFIDKKDTYSVTTYHYISNKYFIFTLNLTNEDEETLRSILSSVKFD